MEKTDIAIVQANKAKIKAYGYATIILALLSIGLVVSNILTFREMYQKFEEVRTQMLYAYVNERTCTLLSVEIQQLNPLR